MCGCNANKKTVVFEKAAVVSALEQKVAGMKVRGMSFDNMIGLFTPVEQDIMAADYYPYPKLEVNMDVLKSLYSLSHFSFAVPNQNGILMKLNVCEHSIYTDGGKRDNERYFHGVIDGVKSFVSLSLFGEKLYCVISYEEDSLDILPLQGGVYRMTRNADVPFLELKCEVVKKNRNERVAGNFKDVKVSVHWDVTTSFDEGYLKSLFSIVKTVYENEGIFLCLEGISFLSSDFERYKNSADVSQLLDFTNGEEATNAKANFNTLCDKQESYSYTQLVENSLTLNASLLAHNLGHNFGAEHTVGDCGTKNDLMGFCHNGRLPLLMIGFNTDTIRVRTGEFATFKPTSVKVASRVVPPVKVAPRVFPSKAPVKVAPRVVPSKVPVKVATPEVVLAEQSKVEVPQEVKVTVAEEVKVVVPQEVKVVVSQEVKVAVSEQVVHVVTPQVARVPFKAPVSVKPSRVPQIQKVQIPATKPPVLYMVKERKGRVYKREVGLGEVVELKLKKGDKYRKLDWELKDKRCQVKSSHPSGTKFYKGDTKVSHLITDPQGNASTLHFTIRVVRH